MLPRLRPPSAEEPCKFSVLTLLLGALDAASGGFEYEDVFRCLKTGLAGLSMAECDILENYALKWEIRGAMWTRETPWSAHPDGYGEEWTDEARARLKTVNALRERVQGPFARLKKGVGGSGTAEQKVRALYDYLEEVNLPETLQAQTEQLFAAGDAQRAEETAQLWGILCGVLDQFVEILGDAILDAEEFASLMRLVLTQYSVGTIPVTLDAVNLCEMTRNDRHTVRALFLLGANDGVLPAAENRGGVLRDEDREVLERQQIFLAPHGMEQFHLEIQNLYAALAQPTEKLTVSYPVSDGKGAEKRPSFVIGRIARLLPSISVETENADKEYRLSAKSTALEYAGEHIGGALWQYFEGQGDAERALAAMKDASSYTRGHLSRDAVRALYGGAVTLSASRMDMARSCHFAYFMRYGLKARERTGAGFDAPQIGTFVHDVMEHTLRQAKECGGLHTLSKDKLHALVRASIEEYIDRVLPDLCEKSARFRYLFNRLCATVERIMDEVSEELQSSHLSSRSARTGSCPPSRSARKTARRALSARSTVWTAGCTTASYICASWTTRRARRALTSPSCATGWGSKCCSTSLRLKKRDRCFLADTRSFPRVFSTRPRASRCCAARATRSPKRSKKHSKRSCAAAAWCSRTRRSCRRWSTARSNRRATCPSR